MTTRAVSTGRPVATWVACRSWTAWTCSSGDPTVSEQRGALTVSVGRVYVPYSGLAGTAAPTAEPWWRTCEGGQPTSG